MKPDRVMLYLFGWSAGFMAGIARRHGHPTIDAAIALFFIIYGLVLAVGATRHYGPRLVRYRVRIVKVQDGAA